MSPPPEARPRVGATRRDPLTLLAAALALLVLRVLLGILGPWQPSLAVAPPASGELVQWHAIESAQDSARAAGRPILYDFTADWCPPCRLMKREVFSDERAARAINRDFYPVRVLDRLREDGRNAPAVDSLERRFRIESFPTLVVASPDDGEPVILSGYRGKSGTLGALESARRALAERHGR